MPDASAPTLNAATAAGAAPGPLPGAGRSAPFVRRDADDRRVLDMMVEGVRCGGCVNKIERDLKSWPEIAEARVNLTTRRLHVVWRGADQMGDQILDRLDALGFPAAAYDPETLRDADRAEQTALLRAMGVAGFAASNVMLMSVAIWAGHGEMGEATRGLLHWVSAAIATPAVLYAGRPFFKSAWAAVARRRTNMDVPISVGVVATVAVSLLETATGGDHAYFESALMLLFFLLLGRFLDRRCRAKARGAAERLLSLREKTAQVITGTGAPSTVSIDALAPGDRILCAAGARLPADGVVEEGRSDLDASLINGETAPKAVAASDPVYAGMINLSAPLTVRVTAVGDGTLLAEMAQLMETAEQAKGRFVALSDRIVRYYTPVVHLMAAIAFIGWWGFAGVAWQPALFIAVAVLIITCPCALGLAAPAVQVSASGALMRSGILLKARDALERLSKVDTVIFDKTGTLTTGRPVLDKTGVSDDDLALAARLACVSTHPLSRALAAAAPDATALEGVTEHPGQGLSAPDGAGREIRLGARDWCGVMREDLRYGLRNEANDNAVCKGAAEGPELWLARPGQPSVRFSFTETLRPGAADAIAALKRDGVEVMLLSGDRTKPVERVAEAVGVEAYLSQCTPAQKIQMIEKLRDQGKSVLMVGDGLNDAPALAAADASFSPSEAADISQTAADAVFQGGDLRSVPMLLNTARSARRLLIENFALALGYNVVAIPFAMAGFVTPLIAAIAMSGSSIVVTLNALRVKGADRPKTEAAV
ncbi:MAG: heavy metal translocating P-type ATPase [Alphaproteobacteria bacterium]|nr:heavy metal translocating P-type ATPase [Alphaproteobacteria bacterium]